MTIRAILVGEQNPYRGHPQYALYPSPPGCAGARLQEKILDVTLSAYLTDYVRANLCSGPWRFDEARAEARSLSVRYPYPPIVLLGVKVAIAFGFPSAPPFSVLSSAILRRPVVVLPHPSGRCRTWHEPDAYERARAALRGAGVID
jgi:hypothetical protein